MKSQFDSNRIEPRTQPGRVCIVCGCATLEPKRPYRCKTRHGKEIFAHSWLHACSDCGLVQTTPSPSLRMLEDYYAVDYRNGCFAGADVADLGKFPLDNLFYYNRGQSIAELIAPRLPASAPRILDIGAGYGHILDALGSRFPDARRTAIEVSQVCVHHLRSLGVTVHAAPAEDVLDTLKDRFDVIILSHVLEHLLDPLTMLRRIRQLLTPGGLLYVEVPHIPPRAMNGYIDSVWAPRFDEPHITFFTPSTLSRTLAASGYSVPFCDTAGLVYRQVSALRFHMPHWRWFLQRAMPPALFQFLRRQRFTQPLKVKSREESFYQYGGFRIWVRCVASR